MMPIVFKDTEWNVILNYWYSHNQLIWVEINRAVEKAKEVLSGSREVVPLTFRQVEWVIEAMQAAEAK